MFEVAEKAGILFYQRAFHRTPRASPVHEAERVQGLVGLLRCSKCT